VHALGRAQDAFDKFNMRHAVDLVFLELWRDERIRRVFAQLAAQEVGRDERIQRVFAQLAAQEDGRRLPAWHAMGTAAACKPGCAACVPGQGGGSTCQPWLNWQHLPTMAQLHAPSGAKSLALLLLLPAALQMGASSPGLFSRFLTAVLDDLMYLLKVGLRPGVAPAEGGIAAGGEGWGWRLGRGFQRVGRFFD
jgi:hypothetical protein